MVLVVKIRADTLNHTAYQPLCNLYGLGRGPWSRAQRDSNEFKGFSTMKVEPRASEKAVETEIHQLVSKSLNAIPKQNLAKRPR